MNPNNSNRLFYKFMPENFWWPWNVYWLKNLRQYFRQAAQFLNPLWPARWTLRVASFLKTRPGHFRHWIFSDSVCFINLWMSSAFSFLRSFPQVTQENGLVLAWICRCCCSCCTFEKVWSQDSHRKFLSYSPWVNKCLFNSWLLDNVRWHQLQDKAFVVWLKIKGSLFISIFGLFCSGETYSWSGSLLMAIPNS